MVKYAPRRKSSAGSGKAKMTVRLLADVDGRLRALTRRQGDLSRIVSEALDQFTVTDPAALPDTSATTVITSVTIDAERRAALRRVSYESGAAASSIINGALAQWIRKQE